MSYRPITDMWFLARAKLKDGRKYYGAYLGGFPERARVLIGATLDEPVLHVCGGMARHYPYARGFGPLDETLDLAPDTTPDFLQDCRDPLPEVSKHTSLVWDGIIADPPYSAEDSAHYTPGSSRYPSPNSLVVNMVAAVLPGKRVGIIHYLVPACPKNAKFVACVGIVSGFNNRIRVFSVFERIH